MAIAVSLSGCLITQPVRFDQPSNSPPSISDAQGAPLSLTRIIQLPRDFTTTGDAGSGRQVSLAVEVFDPDVDQTLNFQVLVDRTPCSTCVEQHGVLSPSTRATGRDRRSTTLAIDQALLLPPNCHSIQLLVSGGFQAGSQMPLEDRDLASATWWVASTDMSTVDMRLCP